MPFSEVKITNLPGISYGAFENCANLEKVDASEDAALRSIGTEAFLNAEKLHIFNFAPELKEETVTVGKHAFKGTAFTTMGDSSSEFDLTAAKFDGAEGYAFSGMPKLQKLYVPASYSNATIPRASFYDNPELIEAIIDYKITEIYNAAFANDDKLERIFIWGDTAIEDKNIGGYTMPTRAVDDTIGDEFGPTIPEGTDIYAYAANITEEYAGYEGRDDFEGKFYPLDEVIYITSNKPTVRLNDEGDDFDKSDLVIYAMRRDGLILQSDSWAEYDGVVYPRSESDLVFEKMASVQQERPKFGAIWDTPVPIDELNFSNENFAEIGFEMLDAEGGSDTKLINVIYTDKYTRGLPDTIINPYEEADGENEPIIPGLPITRDNIIYFVISLIVSVVTIVVLLKIARKKVQN
jgi:hypothetical protein